MGLLDFKQLPWESGETEINSVHRRLQTINLQPLTLQETVDGDGAQE